ncbi:unnamed protein product [Urochloa humidicola]
MGNLKFKWLWRPQIVHSLQLRTQKSSVPFLTSPATASWAGRILPCLEATEPEHAPPALTSGLGAASPADLARRHRSIHPPLLQPAEAPHPSAVVAHAVARAADFSFDFVPRPTNLNRWHPCDVRDGHVLIDCRSFTEGDDDEEELLSLDLAVCNPLSRRHLLLPPVTDDLLASIELENKDMFNSGACFVPSRDMEEETPFSVMCWMHSKTKVVVFFFSSGSDHWTVGTSTSWDDLGLLEEVDSLGSCQCVDGCFHWKVNYTNKLLKLDLNTMELSTYDLPPDHEGADIVIVDSEEGKVAMFSQVGAGTSVKYYNLLQNGTEKSHEWHMKSTIPLPGQYTSEFYINGPAEGYIFLAGNLKEQDAVHSAFFSLEIKSLKIERVSRKTFPFRYALPYFGYPPCMSLRRIQ